MPEQPNEFTFILIGVAIGTVMGLLFTVTGHLVLRPRLEARIDKYLTEAELRLTRSLTVVPPQGGSGTVPAPLPVGGTGRSRTMWSPRADQGGGS